MKAPALPVLDLAAFPPHHRPPGYYIQRLETHVAQFPIVQAPHAHSFYLLLYVTHGHGTHTIDLRTHDLRPGSLFFLTPGQVHCWELSADAQGYILFFDTDFYLRQYPADRLAAYPFFDSIQPPVQYLPADEVDIRPLFERIAREDAHPAAHQAEIVGAYLYLILELAARRYPAAAPGLALPPAHGAQQLRTFSQLLNQHFRTEKTVAYYAGRLHLTANHLNALCRRLLGKTASAVLHERIIAEAQRLLAHSAQTVAQVADALGYDDASYFGRSFKKHTGQTPEAFRQYTQQPNR